MKAINLHLLLDANSSDHSNPCNVYIWQIPTMRIPVCPGVTLGLCESDQRSCSCCVFGNPHAPDCRVLGEAQLLELGVTVTNYQWAQAGM